MLSVLVSPCNLVQTLVSAYPKQHREHLVPVEMHDIKDEVMALALETSGSRFALILAENPSAVKSLE